MAKAQSDPVPNSVADVAVVLVVEALVDRLGLLQLSMGIGEELVALSHALPPASRLVHRSGWRDARGRRRSGMAST
jgi:hypothetical protein